MRSDSAVDVSRRVRVQDCVSDFDSAAADAAASSSRVAAHGAVRNGQSGRYDAASAGGNAAAVAIIGVAYGVAADRAIDDGQN